MILKNAMYLDRNMKIGYNDIKIEGDRIKILNQGEVFHFNGDIVDCSNYIIIPGLINGHTHNPATLGKGIFKDMELVDWLGDSEQGMLQEKLFNYLDNNVETDDFKVLCYKAYIEYIKQGITFIVETGQADDAETVLCEAMKKLGIKGIIDVYDKVEAYRDRSGNDINFCTHLPEEEDITIESLNKCKDIKEKHNFLKMTHCLETQWRKEIVTKSFNKTTVELFNEYDLLDEKTILFHCVHTEDSDIELISEKGATIVYCPISNLWSGTGIARVDKWLNENINVTIGTDFIYDDMWEAMRTAYYMLKVHGKIGDYKAEDIFKMATINGAKAFGFNDIGVIEDGYKADLVFIDKRDTRLWPLINTPGFSNVAHNLLIECRRDIIKHVMVDGKWIMKDRSIVNIDEDKINEEYKKIVEKLYYR